MKTPFAFRIFISYRRDDTKASTGRLYDKLVKKFGENRVFKDVHDIEGGDDWQNAINQSVSSCDICLVMMGNSYNIIDPETKLPRLSSKDDPVRLEIAQALKNPKTLTIPVLVDMEKFPDTSDWPDELLDLQKRNAVLIQNGAQWPATSKNLIKVIQKQYRKLLKGSSKALLYPVWRYKYFILGLSVLLGTSYVLIQDYQAVQKVAASK
ncbi:MAG: toll/interleukin-1 receptor domain-containing protein, partial [Bacteroidota bacterium]